MSKNASTTAPSAGWQGSGYDHERPIETGLFYRLTDKGEIARLRLVTPPYRYMSTIQKNGKPEPTERVAWLAILKGLVNGQVTQKTVIFQAGVMVYNAVRDLYLDKDWGDPTQYDIEVERTQKAGAYYSVTPKPRPSGPLTESQQALVLDTTGSAEPFEYLKHRIIEVESKGRTGSTSDGFDPYAED